jgi:hypothetical protein
MRNFPARRLVCLTEETVETLYLLGEQDRIVGVSGYAVRPPQVRREKPRVSASARPTSPRLQRSNRISFWRFPIFRLQSPPISPARALPSTSSISAISPASSP